MRRVADGESEADLLSYVLFDGEFAGRLIEIGRADARAKHDALVKFFEKRCVPAESLLSGGPGAWLSPFAMRRALAVVLVTLTTSWCAERKPAGQAPSLVASVTPSATPTSTYDLDLRPRPATSTSTSTPHLYVRAHSLPIHPDPSLKGKWIGTLAAGDSVELRDEPPRTAPGCPSVRAVVPRGWACVDGETATLDADDAVWLALRAHAPDYASPWPYSYGESRGARRHPSLPDVETPAWPRALLDSHATIAARSTVAWLDEVDSGGIVVAARERHELPPQGPRRRPSTRSSFHGVALGGEVTPSSRSPSSSAPRTRSYRRDASGRLMPRRARPGPASRGIALTGHTEKHGRATYWETREDGVWLDARDAAVDRARRRAPCPTALTRRGSRSRRSRGGSSPTRGTRPSTRR
jgi:hypothetical protein